MRYIPRRWLPARYRRSAGKKRRLRRWLIPALACGMACWLAISELGLSSLSKELTEEAARGYLLASVNQAVDEELKEGENSFVSVSRAGDGQISAVSANAGELNRLKAGVIFRLSQSLNGKAAAYVPIGSLTDVAVLNGRGPKVPVKLKLESSANVAFHTEFQSAGVNQTCHRITMTVKVRACSQSRRFAVQVEETTATVLAETVVVGQVPGVALTAG